MTFALINHQLVGTTHRCGWPAVQAALAQRHVADGRVLLDDFVERTFTYGSPTTVHERPWVGIFHHSPNMPAWSPPNAAPQVYWRLPSFQASLPHLKLIITLSDYASRWFRQQTDVPVVTLRYALPDLPVTWHPRNLAWREVWQFGWYLRNTELIHQIPTELPRFFVAEPGPAAQEYMRSVGMYWQACETRRVVPGAQERARLSNEEYDRVLASQVLVAEYFDASASTLLLECLATATPLLINAHPALMEYLGAEYPLYAHGPAHYAQLLEHPAILQEGHNYLLQRRQTGDLPTAATFAGTVADLCQRLGV